MDKAFLLYNSSAFCIHTTHKVIFVSNRYIFVNQSTRFCCSGSGLGALNSVDK